MHSPLPVPFRSTVRFFWRFDQSFFDKRPTHMLASFISPHNIVKVVRHTQRRMPKLFIARSTFGAMQRNITSQTDARFRKIGTLRHLKGRPFRGSFIGSRRSIGQPLQLLTPRIACKQLIRGKLFFAHFTNTDVRRRRRPGSRPGGGVHLAVHTPHSLQFIARELRSTPNAVRRNIYTWR
jgi:hypothetical protein